MPGVNVITKTISGPSTRSRAAGARYFVAGITERGPTTEAVIVRSLADYEDQFGARVTYGALHDDLNLYFAEGGQEAVVCRVVGTTPVLATLTLLDRAGAPAPTIRIDAKNAGAWGNALTVAVAEGEVTNTVTVTIGGVPVGSNEVLRNLGPAPADIAAAITAGSRWVNAVDLGSATASPNNRPAVVAATALAAGTDDRATVNAASYTTALDTLATLSFGDGAAAVPGQPSSAVGAGLISHAQNNHRIALLTTAAGVTPTAAKTAATALSRSEFAGLFYPWVVMNAGGGTTRTVAPTGYVAAARARAILEEGPWRAGAGLISQARAVLGLERELTRAQGDDLDDGRVNALRTIARTIRVYGWRSLSTDTANWLHLTGRDTVNRAVVASLEAMEAYVFRPIDGKGHLFAEVEGDLTGIVEPMANAGGLYARIDPESGETLDPGYRVDTSSAVNTPSTIAQGIIGATLALRVSPTGHLVVVTIAKAQLTAAL